MSNPEPAFSTIPLDRGVTLHHRRSDRFKTELVRVFLRAPVDERRTLRHLFAALMTRGTQGSPTRRELAARLQNMYGAGYGVAAQRIAGRHVLALRSSTAAGRFLPGRPNNLAAMLQFLSEVLAGPPTAPLEDVFEYERRNLLRDLAARLNNKGRYALGRLHEEMYAGTPLAGPDVGTVEAIQEASLSDAVAEGMRTVSEGEVDIYLLAPCTPLQAERLVRRHLKLQPRRRERFSSVPLRPPRRRVRTVREAMDVEQGKLLLGFRLEDWGPRESPHVSALADAVFGGGPASKLFKNVREKRSLCYDVRSWIDQVNGSVGVQAGIKPENYAAALRAIRAHVRDMVRGKISDEEVERARQAIEGGLRTVPDSQAGLVEFFYRSRLLKRKEKDLAAVLRGVQRAAVSDIPRLFERARLDTIYFLDQKEADHAVA